MKNTIYAVVIAVCILGAVLLFWLRGSGSGNAAAGDTQMVLVKCAKCSQSYEMTLKEYYKEQQEKAKTAKSPMMAFGMSLTCQKCGQNGVRQAFKCANPKCGEVFFANSVPGDIQDRCPKCKQSATEASRKRQQGAQ